MTDDLVGLLADHGIRLNRLTPGHSEPHAICPKCGKDGLSVSVDEDGLGAVWNCKRGSCIGFIGNVRVGREAPKKADAWPPKALPRHPKDKPDWLYQFWADRKVGARVVDKFGVYATNRSGLPAIVFPYKFRGETVTLKYRARDDKAKQSQDNSGAPPILFNADVLDRAGEIIWVEGEPDVLALEECGITNAVSLRDGAPQVANFKQDNARFAALQTHHVELDKIQKFILAGDMDPSGIALMTELERRLGRHKVSVATWPKGCKDAGDVLRDHGPDAVILALEQAKQYPIDGIQEINEDTLVDLGLQPDPPILTTGASASDKIIQFPGEGRLIVISGFPNHGKTAWARFVMVHTIREHNRRWLVFSPEHQPWEQFAAEVAEVHAGKPFRAVGGMATMTEQDRRLAGRFLAGRVRMLVADANDTPTVDWIIERAVASVQRHGTTDLLIDPWNEVEHDRGAASETDYTAKCLQRFKNFMGLRHGCNVWIIAHPAKPPPIRQGEDYRPPNGYDISGSAHWANKTDVGVTVWLPRPEADVELVLWKCRHRRWGTRGSTARLEFERASGRYKNTLSDVEPEPEWMRYHGDGER